MNALADDEKKLYRRVSSRSCEIIEVQGLHAPKMWAAIVWYFA